MKRQGGAHHHRVKENPVEIRKAHLELVKAVEGRWDAAAAHLGMSRSSLENRIYERKGQQLSTDDSLQLQALAGLPHFAAAVAARTGGVFVAVPGVGDDADNDELLSKFTKLTSRFGELARRHAEATADGEVDAAEKADLMALGNDIHQAVQELLHCTFHIYCKPETLDAAVAPIAGRAAGVRA